MLRRTSFLCKTEKSTLVAKQSLDIRTYDGSFQYKFLHCTLHIKFFITFISACTTPSNMNSLHFFIKHKNAILKMSLGEDLFISLDLFIIKFKQYTLIIQLPIFSNTQGVESSIKDIVHSKVTGRYKETISTSTFMRSVSITKITFSY